MKKSMGSDGDKVRWGKTPLEVQKGRLPRPPPISLEAMRPTPITPRYAIREGRATGAKYRPIDEFRSSGPNDIVSTDDTDSPQTLDTCLSLARLYESVCPGFQHAAVAADFDPL